MATITYMSFLMHGTGTGTLTWADLCPIKDYPDFMNDVNAIDITDLQQNMHTYIMGLKPLRGRNRISLSGSVARKLRTALSLRLVLTESGRSKDSFLLASLARVLMKLERCRFMSRPQRSWHLNNRTI